MGKDSDAVRRLSLPLDFDKGDDLAALDDIAASAPRAAAIVATALVEDALRWCLCGSFNPAVHTDLFDTNSAPLGPFHAKIVMGHALGIYGIVTRTHLLAMKHVRNAFAHSPRSITFESLEIRKICLSMRYVGSGRNGTAERSRDNDPRQMFLATARLLIFDLHCIGSRDPSFKTIIGEMP